MDLHYGGGRECVERRGNRRVADGRPPVRAAARTFVPAVLVAALACSGPRAEDATLAHVLGAQRTACEDRAGTIAERWADAHKQDIDANLWIAAYALSNEGKELMEIINIRRKQAAPLLSELGQRKQSEARSALVDLAAKLASFCALAEDPVSYSIIGYNEKRRESRSALDETWSRASILLSGEQIAAEKQAALDAEVATAIEILRAEAAKQKALEEEEQARQERARLEEEELQRVHEAEDARDRAQARTDAEAKAAASFLKLQSDRRAAAERNKAKWNEDCVTSKAWLDQRWPEIRVVYENLDKLTCSQLVDASRGLGNLTVAFF